MATPSVWPNSFRLRLRTPGDRRRRVWRQQGVELGGQRGVLVSFHVQRLEAGRKPSWASQDPLRKGVRNYRPVNMTLNFN